MKLMLVIISVIFLASCGGGASSDPAQISSSSSSSSLPSKTLVKEVVSNFGAFAALLDNGRVVTWGHATSGGDRKLVSSQLENIQKVYKTQFAFAALKEDGSVITWGDKDYGGDSSAIKDQLVNVRSIRSSDYNFAAIKHDGSVVIWGWIANMTPSPNKLLDIEDIYFVDGQNLAVAKKKDGSIDFWGKNAEAIKSSDLFRGINNIDYVVTISNGFSIIKKDGEILSDRKNLISDWEIQPQQYQSIDKIYTGDSIYMALRKDGSTFVWGLKFGDSASNEYIKTVNNLKKVIFNNSSVLVLRNDGMVTMIGDCPSEYNLQTVSALDLTPKDLNSITDIVTTKPYDAKCTYAALRSDGSVYTWGHKILGGNSEFVQSDLVNVKKIVPTSRGFAALKADKTVVFWGDIENEYGKNVQAELKDVKDIYSTDLAFAVVKEDGRIFSWGQFIADGYVDLQ